MRAAKNWIGWAGCMILSAWMEAQARDLQIVNATVDCGGHVASTGGMLRLGGSLGQTDAGLSLSGGALALNGGFWPGAGHDVPDNDACQGAIGVAIGAQFVGTTLNCGIDDAYPGCGDGTEVIAPGAWFSVIGDGTRLVADTCAGADYNTKINVYSGSCGAPICVGGNNNSCGVFSRVTWDSAAGVQYLVLVHGTLNESGEFTLTVAHDSGSFDCEGVDNLKATCRDGSLKVKGVLTTHLPEGTPVRLTMDDTTSKETTINSRGKAKAVFKNVSAGAHVVCLDECPEFCSSTTCNP